MKKMFAGAGLICCFLGVSAQQHEVRTLGLYLENYEYPYPKIPDARLVELDDVGHMPHIEAFDRFIRPLLDFLKD